VRTTDLKDVCDRPPLILYAQNKQTDKTVLHIARRQGMVVRAGGQWGTVAQITECNRIAEYWNIWSGVGYNSDHRLSIPQFLDLRGDEFKLCEKCGDLHDFEEALTGFLVNKERLQKEQEERLLREKEEEQAKAAQKDFELQHFIGSFLTADAPLSRASKFVYEYKVPNSGVVITLRAEWKDD